MTQLSTSVAVFECLPGRPYGRGDLPVLRVLAGGSGVTSVLASAIFLNDVGARGTRSGFVWFVLFLQTTWLGRCFFVADRGHLNEDIVLFVIADVHSYVARCAALAVIAAG